MNIGNVITICTTPLRTKIATNTWNIGKKLGYAGEHPNIDPKTAPSPAAIYESPSPNALAPTKTSPSLEIASIIKNPRIAAAKEYKIGQLKKKFKSNFGIPLVFVYKINVNTA